MVGLGWQVTPPRKRPFVRGGGGHANLIGKNRGVNGRVIRKKEGREI